MFVSILGFAIFGFPILGFATFGFATSVALLGPEGFRLLVTLVLLIGVPLFFLAVVVVVTGYIRHDADQFLEELEEEYGTPESRSGGNDPARSSGEGSDGEPTESRDDGE